MLSSNIHQGIQLGRYGVRGYLRFARRRACSIPCCKCHGSLESVIGGSASIFRHVDKGRVPRIEFVHHAVFHPFKVFGSMQDSKIEYT